MTDVSDDGLCGVIAPFTKDGSHFRCQWELAHGGDHSWKRYERQFYIFCGIRRGEIVERAQQGSVAARAMLGIPRNCSCQPLFSTEGEIVEYLFSPDCEAHAT